MRLRLFAYVQRQGPAINPIINDTDEPLPSLSDWHDHEPNLEFDDTELTHPAPANGKYHHTAIFISPICIHGRQFWWNVCHPQHIYLMVFFVTWITNTFVVGYSTRIWEWPWHFTFRSLCRFRMGRLLRVCMISFPFQITYIWYVEETHKKTGKQDYICEQSISIIVFRNA